MERSRLQPPGKRALTTYAAALAAACGLAAGGCAGGADASSTHEALGRAIQPIIGGEASGTSHDAVVVLALFQDGGRRGLCSATLVAPNLLLTARHCVSETDSSAACGLDGEPVIGAGLHGDRAAADFAVFVGKDGVAPPSTSEAAASARGARLVVDDAHTICNRDLAFVVLDRDLSAPIAPLRLSGATAADELTAVGWGLTEEGKLPSRRLARSDVAWIGAGPMLFPESTQWGIGDAEFMIGESACAGDSGSPALAKSGAVVGVASRAGNGKPRDPANPASPCMGPTAHAVYTHLGAAKDLVARAFAAAGHEPWLEGEPDPRAPAPPAPCDAGTCGDGGASAPARTPPQVLEGEKIAPEEDHGGAAEAGCSAGRPPRENAVGQALGASALLALALRARRRLAARARS